jgi:threonine dehydrogenase-like Zn-dependent dehydrogenase
MRAVCWNGKKEITVETVPDPKILNPGDCIVKITATAICGSDLHLYDGFIPGMRKGDILGHEFMGEVVEVGHGVKKIKVGDRVIVPFPISCGACWFCKEELWSLCDNTNPNAALLELMYGASGAGIFGYSHLYGGYAGGQAEYVRVPHADVGPFRIENGLSDDQVLFLTDILPTGWMAAENCDIQEGDTVAVWGAGPVGQFAIRSALLMGAAKVIAIDRFRERLDMAQQAGATVIDYEDSDVREELKALTGGRGPDSCIDAVGMEAHGTSIDARYDRAKQMARVQIDRVHVIRQAIQACRKGGTLSIPGVYGGFIDKVNFGAAFAKGLQLRMGQTHVHKYLPELLGLINEGKIKPEEIITHRLTLEDAPEAYEIFAQKEDECIKVVMKP